VGYATESFLKDLSIVVIVKADLSQKKNSPGKKRKEKGGGCVSVSLPTWSSLVADKLRQKGEEKEKRFWGGKKRGERGKKKKRPVTRKRGKKKKKKRPKKEKKKLLIQECFQQPPLGFQPQKKRKRGARGGKKKKDKKLRGGKKREGEGGRAEAFHLFQQRPTLGGRGKKEKKEN